MSLSNTIIASSIVKKNELERLKSQIARTEFKIQKLTARTIALTKKQGDFTLYLADAKSNKDIAETNEIHVKQVTNSIKETFKKIKHVIEKTKSSNDEISSTSLQMSVLIKALVYSVELIDALAVTINKKKAANALIPDDLITVITTASADANNAIALCLTALESCNVAMTSSDQTHEITLLEYIQSLELYGLITGNAEVINHYIKAINVYQKSPVEKNELALHHQYLRVLDAKASNGEHGNNNALTALLNKARIEAKQKVESAAEAKKRVDQELAQSSGQLDKESSVLESLKAGLAAANAAALAA
jgi:DNA-binding CsgD family transcriptional regulator